MQISPIIHSFILPKVSNICKHIVEIISLWNQLEWGMEGEGGRDGGGWLGEMLVDDGIDYFDDLGLVDDGSDRWRHGDSASFLTVFLSFISAQSSFLGFRYPSAPTGDVNRKMLPNFHLFIRGLCAVIEPLVIG